MGATAAAAFPDHVDGHGGSGGQEQQHRPSQARVQHALYHRWFKPNRSFCQMPQDHSEISGEDSETIETLFTSSHLSCILNGPFFLGRESSRFIQRRMTDCSQACAVRRAQLLEVDRPSESDVMVSAVTPSGKEGGRTGMARQTAVHTARNRKL